MCQMGNKYKNNLKYSPKILQYLCILWPFLSMFTGMVAQLCHILFYLHCHIINDVDKIDHTNRGHHLLICHLNNCAYTIDYTRDAGFSNCQNSYINFPQCEIFHMPLISYPRPLNHEIPSL